MTALVHKIDFSHLSDDDEDEVDLGSELSIASMSSSGCEADDSKNLSPSLLSGPATGSGGAGDARTSSSSSSVSSLFLQRPAMTSSPRSSAHKCQPTPVLTRSASRLLRHRGSAAAAVVGLEAGSPTYGSSSPPYKRIKGLNLGDMPATPRTLLGKCMLPPQKLPPAHPLSHPQSCSAVGAEFSPCAAVSFDTSAGSRIPCLRRSARKVATRSRLSIGETDPTLGSGEPDKQRANVNPFTPRGRLLSGRKRLRDSVSSDLSADRSLLMSSNDCSMEDGDLLSTSACSSSRRVSLAETEVSRLEREFAVQDVIGSGEFGCVFRCINRLDGCTYAVKRSHRTVAGGAHERAALNEVYAHAVLGQHAYIVRYYSAWSEQGHMLIQNEFCGRGSLATLLDRHRQAGTRMTEWQIRRMLVHVARGLRYIHSMSLCHLDLKPENIFITDNSEMMMLSPSRCVDSPITTTTTSVGSTGSTAVPLASPAPNGGGGVGSSATATKYRRSRAVSAIYADDNTNDETSSDDGFEDDHDPVDEDVIYKIGDFGHVTSMDDPFVEEGDCRYMPREILHEDYSQLDRADMFALGLTAVECASGQQLPKNGERWQQLRDGQLPQLPDISDQLLALIRQLVDPQPQRRPDSAQLLANGYLLPPSCRSRAQLRRQLADERLRNRQLRSQLAQLGVAAIGDPRGGGSGDGGMGLTPQHPPQQQQQVMSAGRVVAGLSSSSSSSCSSKSCSVVAPGRLVGRGALRSRSTNF